jgi:hypothetical protein
MAGQGDQGMAALLRGLLSADNDTRAQAETAFGELKKHPDACVSELVQGLRANPDMASRSLCAVLLRKVRGEGQGCDATSRRRDGGPSLSVGAL